MNAVAQQDLAPPKIGERWSEHGGMFIGSRLVDGVVRHLVIPGGVEHDLIDVEFGKAEVPAEINGFSDWVVPEQKDLMLAYLNVPDMFDKDDWYWSSTQNGPDFASAVVFEYGYVFIWGKNNEFRVRPVRVINSPI